MGIMGVWEGGWGILKVGGNREKERGYNLVISGGDFSGEISSDDRLRLYFM